MKRRYTIGFFTAVLAMALSAGRPLPADQCSVTASGWVHSSELGSFQATITVTGPCDASLADRLRQAIADLRAGFK
jgi:hypothetical protein